MGRLGKDALSASAFTFPIFQMITALGAGFGIGGMIIFSRNLGARKFRENLKAKSQLLTVNVVVSILLSIVTVTFSKEILSLSGATGILLELSNQYTKILFMAIPFVFIINTYNAIENSKGKTIKPMLLVLASTILNVILNSFFLYLGKGIEGIAIATVIANIILSAFTLFDSIVKKKDIFFRYMGWNSKLALSIIKLGIPVSLTSATANLGFIVLNRYVVEYGATVLAAFGIGNRVNNIFYTPANGISTAVSIMVAQNLGAENFKRVKNIFRISILFSLTTGILGAIFLLVFNRELTAVFTKDPEITKHTLDFIQAFAFSTIPWAIYKVIVGYFQGEGFTKLNFYIDLGRVWVFRIPVLLLIQKIFNLGTYSLWYAMLISNILVMLVVLIIYFGRNLEIVQKKTKKLEKVGDA